VEDILFEQIGIVTTRAEMPAVPLHICRGRENWRTELLVAINDAVNGMYPLQEIKICCGGRLRARRAARDISRSLKRRKGIDIDYVNNIDLESDDDEETEDCIVNVYMNGTWIIRDYITGEMVDRSGEVDRQIRWRMLAWIVLEKTRPWPKLARLQWIVKTQIERGEKGMNEEDMRQIYEAENYYDTMYYETGERCQEILDDDTVNEIRCDTTTLQEIAESSTYTTTLRNSAPYHKETTGVEEVNTDTTPDTM